MPRGGLSTYLYLSPLLAAADSEHTKILGHRRMFLSYSILMGFLKVFLSTAVPQLLGTT